MIKNLTIGLCGLPNSGKSTFLKLVTNIDNAIAPHMFSTLESKEGIAFVCSQNLRSLHTLTKTEKLVMPYLKFIDVPGLIQGAHQGQGLGNEFLSYLRGCKAIFLIARNFFDIQVPSVNIVIDPLNDIITILTEIIFADKAIIDKSINKLLKEHNKDNKKIIEILGELAQELDMAVEHLSNNNLDKVNFLQFSRFNDVLKDFNLLVTKKWFLLINGLKYDLSLLENLFIKTYNLDLKWELDLLQENGDVDNINKFLYDLALSLELIEFFTFNNLITQGWFTAKNSMIADILPMIHSDFVKSFKIAEVVSLDDFLRCGSWEACRQEKVIRLKGRNSFVENNDIIFIKI
ncbi:MAG: ribosome-binding ATPase YchF [Candidatus Parcubacteria bacterium]|nr:MAG: ribosome-binding ATPase YchF [Candidatus Parcubacteria bacterium]